jgi:tetratricopeptide (TPR) repeat protein
VPAGKIGTILMAVILTGLYAGPVSATSYQVPVGPRAIAMGGAFTAISDDISAIFWNPAGLAQIGHQELIGTHANLYGADITDNYFAFLLPVSERQAAAVDWYRSGFDDEELGFGLNRFDLSYSIRPHSRFSVGANFKFLTQDIDLDGVSVRSDKGQGMDLGAMVFPYKNVQLGIVVQDVFDTQVGESDDASTATFPRNTRVGIAYDYRQLGTVAFDVDDRYHLGAEVRPIKQIAIRGGFEKDREGDEDPTYSFGAGVEYGIFRFDYAYVIPPVLKETSHMGLSIAFNFNPSRVRIEKVAVDDIYASQYKTYARAPVATARVRNLLDTPLTTKITTFAPGLMQAPTQQEVILRPKATQEIPLNAVFSDNIMAQEGDKPVQIQVTTTYQSRNLLRTDKGSGRGVVYGPGAIDWGKGVEQAAAFVTSTDPAVDALARQAVRQASAEQEDAFGNRNLLYAAALFDALGAIGVTYVPDPNNPYSTMSETPKAVDTVHYPRQTLEKRSGDCDDTSILMAALLGNVGVPTKLVDVPGHVFLLLDTGLHERNRLNLSLDESMYVIADDGVWIPLETTLLGKGFNEAWTKGADEYTSWQARGLVQLADVTEAQAVYAPSALPGLPARPVELNEGFLRTALATDAQAVAAWKNEFMTTRYAGVSGTAPASAAAMNELAHVYFLAGELDKARTNLEQVLTGDPKSASASNNLANVHAATGDAEKAIDHYWRALDAAPNDPGIWLNLGLVVYAYGDTTTSMAPIEEGLRLSGGYEEACGILGLKGETLDRGLAPQKEKTLSPEEARALLKSVMARIPSAVFMDTTSAGTGVPADAKKPVAPARPARTRIAATRAGERMVLQDYLYWKE